MARVFGCFLTLLCTAGLSAQSGVTAEWDVKANMSAMAGDIRALEPLLRKTDPADWVAKGASDVYVRQLQSAQASLAGLVGAADKLSQHPENLAVALDAFFQMERMELLAGSLREGVRRYQSHELADTLARAFAGTAVHRDRLRQHIRDLAATREQEFQVANQEAQRCRGMILRETPPAKKPEKRKTR